MTLYEYLIGMEFQKVREIFDLFNITINEITENTVMGEATGTFRKYSLDDIPFYLLKKKVIKTFYTTSYIIVM